MNKRIQIWLLLSVCTVFSGYAGNVCDSLFAVFDHELESTQAYINIRQYRIDSLLRLQSVAVDPYDINCLLTSEYQHYKSKEAREYVVRNLESSSKNESRYLESTIRLGFLLASTGNFNEAKDMLEPLSVTRMNQYEKAAYYDCMNHLYGEAGFYSKTEAMKQAYFHLADLYDDSLTAVLPANSARRYRQLEAQWRNRRMYDSSLAMNDSLLMSTEEYSQAYASYAFCRSETYRMMGDEDMQLEWLLRSAIADVRNGITDNGSSWMVAQICYNRGALGRAYRYIEYSLNNSNIYGATLRHGQIGPLMSIINNEYQMRLNKQQRMLYALLAAVSILLFVLAMLFILIQHRNRKLQRLHIETEQLNRQMAEINGQLSQTNMALRESNHVKEEYIAHYLNLYSEYIDRLKSLKRDPEFTQREVERFYQVFDSTFLSLYPDFVEKFNSLLQSESRIVLKKGELLNTELRIFALIRLGITNSAKIAQLLRYSPNTIYNYRAKIKNQAQGNRDDFEDRVRQIGTFTF